VSTEENKDKVRSFYAKVFNQKNHDEALKEAKDIFSDEYVLHYRDADIDVTVNGPDGIANLVSWTRAPFSGLEASIIGEPMEVEGNRVVTRFKVSATYKEEEEEGMSERPVEVEGMSISQFSETEGKIKESWMIWETGRFYEQMDLLDPGTKLKRPLFS